MIKYIQVENKTLEESVNISCSCQEGGLLTIYLIITVFYDRQIKEWTPMLLW